MRQVGVCSKPLLKVLSRSSAKDLEQLAIRRIRAKQRMDEGLSRRIEMQSRQTPIRVSNCHLVPGGRWLLALAGTTKCILVVARLRAGEFKIEVYSLDLTQSIPGISILGTIAPSQAQGSVLVSGPYIARIWDMRNPVIECFNWEQCLSRKQFDYTAIRFSLPPSHFIQPKRLLSSGFLICNSSREIYVFKLTDFQPVSRLGETDPTPAVPYWWYTPDDFKIPSWPLSANLSPLDAHLQPSSFVGSFYLTGCTEHVFRLYLQNGEPVVQRISFKHLNDFLELGWDSGIRVLKGLISSLRTL
ncbi:hypothetical protein M407DRAFT_10763 [Tulasnella calospora MUT 4182]|uniref:Uncharacterized protein n=1 Tax=Tulasnella calospora MUT 4182 TaxID=1051891 RepID=A0A0C3KGR7_9AGAM|nr:hypothetical protein M407DRAFT_10763 [Tulasnella calospora MUT 4182]